MKKLFSILAAIMILAAASFSATAQEVSQDYKESVKELLALSNMRQSTEETVTAGFNKEKN